MSTLARVYAVLGTRIQHWHATPERLVLIPAHRTKNEHGRAVIIKKGCIGLFTNRKQGRDQREKK
jgi:hypothetical protein